jgi:hypothetical protein
MYDGCEFYRPLEQLTLEEYERVSEEYRLYKQCAHCPLRFRQAENVGQFQCRLHPGVLAYDMYRYGDYYSCCGGTSNSVGCLAADHIDRELELPLDDVTLRQEKLFEQAFVVVPCGLFGYGLMPPARSATLWQSMGASGAERSTCFSVSFNPELEERFVHREVAHEVSDWVRDSPVLLRTLPGAKTGGQITGPPRSESLRRIEGGWRTSLDREEEEEMQDEDEEERRRRSMTRPDYVLPYLIVSRIG